MEIAGQEIHAQLDVMTSPMGFAELYERHFAVVYRTALRITGNPADAEDVLQTVFLRILNQGSRLNPTELHQAYFRRASANAAVDLLRRRASHAESRLEDSSPSATVESQPLLKERLRRAIATLEYNDAVLFLLRYVEGLSNGELAEMFDLDKNSIAVRLHRIRQTLQSEMER
jgi:RNA polymerase sigma-70 factor (ECF subfamily)